MAFLLLQSAIGELECLHSLVDRRLAEIGHVYHFVQQCADAILVLLQHFGDFDHVEIAIVQAVVNDEAEGLLQLA